MVVTLSRICETVVRPSGVKMRPIHPMTDHSRRSHTTPRKAGFDLARARASMAGQLSLMAAGFASVVFIYDRLNHLPLNVDSLMPLFMAVAGIISWYLLKTRHYAAVTWFMVAILVVVAVLSTIFYGSSRTISIALLPVAQVAVGIFLSEQALMVSTILLVGLFGALTYVDAQGLLIGKPTFEVGWRTWISQVACLMSVAMMMYLNRTQFKDAEAQHVKEAHHRLKTQFDRDLGLDRFQRIFHSSPTPFFIQSSRTGHIVDVNQAFAQATGYGRNEVLNRRDGFLWVHDEHYAAFSHERRHHRRTDWMPVSVKCSDGRVVALNISSERDDDPEEGLIITALCWPEESGELAPPTGLIPLAAYDDLFDYGDAAYPDTVFDEAVRND